MPPRALLPVLCVLAAGCDRVEADFVLQLSPRVPLDQQPMDGDVSVRLMLRDALGTTALPIEASDDGWRRDALPPLEGVWTGILVESPPQRGGGYDPATLAAFGEVGPFDLARDAEVHADVLVAAFAAVGDLGTLPDGTGSVGSALAITPAGDAWLFGGAAAFDPISTPARSTYYRLTDLHGGTWAFEEAGEMPSVLGFSARFEPSATLVEVDGRPAVLVVGGRLNGAVASGNLASAFLLDAETGAIVWSGATTIGRSGHRAVRLESGRVLLVGGLEGEEVGEEPAAASFTIFDPATRTFTAGDPLGLPARGLALATLGADGALVCGGAAPTDGGGRTATDVCHRITHLGDVRTAAPLPSPRADLAMTPLADGGVLATGGVSDVAIDAPAAAHATAWRYDLADDAWTPLPDLATARARHALVPTPDGRVVVLGGVAAWGPDWYANGAPVEAVERFDPLLEMFEAVESTGTGAGAWPLVATGTPGLALALSGWRPDDTSGPAFGVIGLGPDVSP